MPIVVTVTGPREFPYSEVVDTKGMKDKSEIIVYTQSTNRYVITLLDNTTGLIFFTDKNRFPEGCRGNLVGSKKLPDNTIHEGKTYIIRESRD